MPKLKAKRPYITRFSDLSDRKLFKFVKLIDEAEDIYGYDVLDEETRNDLHTEVEARNLPDINKYMKARTRFFESF